MYLERIHQLLQNMQAENITNQLISDPISIEYFTGYYTDPGERLILLNISQNNTNQIYLNRLFPKIKLNSELEEHFEVILYNDGEPILNQLVEKLDDGLCGIDKIWPSQFLLELMAIKPDLQPTSSSYLVDEMRAIKSKSEQDKMIQASKLNDQAMEKVMSLLELGLTEKQMKQRLDEIYLELSGNSFSFEPIIAYGGNGADPHHETDDSLPKLGDSIVIDIGSSFQGYCSDMTRTAFYGQASEKALNVYQIVKKANEAAIDAIRPGMLFSEIDHIARDIITDAGYGEYFTHRLGHFIGREVHEAGDVSAFNHDTVKVGQIFSIEPGIYLPDELGVRIEDLVLVTDDGCQVLNHFTKEPIIIKAQ